MVIVRDLRRYIASEAYELFLLVHGFFLLVLAIGFNLPSILIKICTGYKLLTSGYDERPLWLTIVEESLLLLDCV